MISLEEARNLFNDYVKQFDLKQKPIMGKFHHSYRVVAYAKAIARSLELDERMCHLVYLCALFHDLGRFKQMQDYHTFDDLKSLDHAKLGYDILKEGMINKLTDQEDEQNIILFAVRYHGAKEVPNGSEEELLVARIVRDADKMDILKEQGLVIKEDHPIISQVLFDNLMHKETCDKKDAHNSCDMILLMLGFIFDINFKYTFEFVLKEKIIENKINLLEVNTHQDLSELYTFLSNYIKGVISC